MDGTVISRNVDVGQTVAASFQTPTLFNIAQDLTKMQIDTNVDEADIGKIKVDQPVEFTVDAYPDTTFKGKVSEVRKRPITVQNVVTYDVVVQVDNPELKLKPGMTANVSIILDGEKRGSQDAQCGPEIQTCRKEQGNGRRERACGPERAWRLGSGKQETETCQRDDGYQRRELHRNRFR